MKTRLLSILFLLLIVFVSSYAQTNSPKFELDGYVKYMQTNSFTDVNNYWMSDNLIHNRLDFSFYSNKGINLKLSARNRFFYGQQISSLTAVNMGDMYFDMMDTDAGFFDLSWNYLEKKSFFFNTSIDRAYIDIQKGKWNITAGRHRINWGQTFVWNANDLFNTYSYFDFDYEEKPGSDALRVQYNLNYASRIDLAASINNDTSITAAALYSFNKFNFDFQVLSGLYRSNDIVLGAGFAGNLFMGGLRGEASYFHPVETIDTTGVITASIGYDYVFKNAVMVQVEALFNTSAPKDGGFSLTELYTIDLSAKNMWISRFGAFASVSYPISPIINVALAGMYSPQNNFIFAGPSVSFWMADSFMLDLNVQFFDSDIPVDEGGKGTYAFLRGRWSF